MVGSWSEMNQGSRTGKGTAFIVCRRPEELYPGGDRAFVVARKRSNARGAKGGRKVEPLNQRRREANTVNVLWAQFGEEQQRCKASAAARCLLAASETRVNHGSSLNDPWVRRSISSGVNYQLESRMQNVVLPLMWCWARKLRAIRAEEKLKTT